MVLIITPSSMEVDAKGGLSLHKLVAIGNVCICYKVKIRPHLYKLYKVRPVIGFIEPNGFKELKFHRLNGPPGKDLIEIQYIIVPHGYDSEITLDKGTQIRRLRFEVNAIEKAPMPTVMLPAIVKGTKIVKEKDESNTDSTKEDKEIDAQIEEKCNRVEVQSGELLGKDSVAGRSGKNDIKINYTSGGQNRRANGAYRTLENDAILEAKLESGRNLRHKKSETINKTHNNNKNDQYIEFGVRSIYAVDEYKRSEYEDGTGSKQGRYDKSSTNCENNYTGYTGAAGVKSYYMSAYPDGIRSVYMMTKGTEIYDGSGASESCGGGSGRSTSPSGGSSGESVECGNNNTTYNGSYYMTPHLCTTRSVYMAPGESQKNECDVLNGKIPKTAIPNNQFSDDSQPQIGVTS